MQVFIIKLIMKDFIKNKLKENLEKEKIDTSKIKIKTAVVNNLFVFLPFYDGERMGAFRLRPFNNDYKVFETILYDRFKGQGIGKGIYRFIIKKLATEGKKLYSDDKQSQEAHNVWLSLVKNNLATQLDNETFVSSL
jgi:hypothetical protein